ncbi:hypothetical protein RD792_014484 [Penstemon davidsonii]|uniref:SBP-type domain-containing protein n=1 Tax=Penstemon davidsonii TaxID=160366 RepID=A0ABR0CPF9_9LAMI|nr:hypothetical protein RD792_014484 [Penstemon davidsonii]
MERRSTESSKGLEWQNLALYGGNKPNEIQQHVGFSMYSSSNNGFGSSSENPNDSYRSTYGTINSSGASAPSTEPTIGLRLGRQKEYGENSSVPVSSIVTKRSRASHNMQNPCCQVEGCNLDLSTAKDYHRRHRICESHSKSPKVVVAGMERRFCQQCSRISPVVTEQNSILDFVFRALDFSFYGLRRFHDLSEFDDKKRSCRKRLSDHNARRRRLQPESIQLSSAGAGLSSALYDRRPPNVLLNGMPIAVSNSTWENAGTSSILRQTRDSLIRPMNSTGLGRTMCFSSNEIPMNSSPRVLDQCLHVHTTNSTMGPTDIQSAHSLLSSNSWSLSEAESTTSMEGLVHGNYNPMWPRFQSDNVPAEEGGTVSPVHSVNFQNASPSHLQEFQLFKAPYESGCFYSNQRNL